MTYETLELLIDGEWTEGTSDIREDVINPATGEVLGVLPHASTADLDRALAAAERGFKAWSSQSAYARQQVMEKAAQIMEARKAAIAETCTKEMGKPLNESLIEMDFVIGQTRWCGEEGKRAYGRMIPPRIAAHRQLVLREPVGPSCAFVAWNFPGTNVIRKIAHALGAGCSLIIKPSEETPGTAIAIARAFHEAGVPAGALQVVFGVPAEVSKHLIASPVTRKLSFTGSTAVGKLLQKMAAETLMRTTMELGGHAPVMVFDDADIGAAAKAIAGFKFRNAGQVCISPTRFLVQNKVYGDFVDAFIAEAKAVNVGNGMDEGVTMGPLIAERRVDAMDGFIADAKSSGGSVVLGGERMGNQGHFFEPTVLTDVPKSARIMNEEPFGPVAPIGRFDDLNDGLEEANRLEVGLAAYAFTTDGNTADQLTNHINAGMLGINTPMISLPETPFGGVDESGFGSEGGIEGLEAYQRTRFVVEKR